MRIGAIPLVLLLCFLALSIIALEGALAFALPVLVLAVFFGTGSLPDRGFYTLCAGEIVVLSAGLPQAILLQLLLLGFVLGEAGRLPRLRDAAGFLAFSISSWAFVAVTLPFKNVFVPFIILAAVLAIGYAAIRLQNYAAIRGLS